MQTCLSLALCRQSQGGNENRALLYLCRVLYIRIHTNKLSSEKLRRQNLIFIYEDRPVSREVQRGWTGGGGGTGIEGAESGVEGAESGVEGAGSGSRGGGNWGNCGRGSEKIGGRNCFFY